MRLIENTFRIEGILPLAIAAQRATILEWRKRSPSASSQEQRQEPPLRLEQGESFVVTRNGVPVGELTPLRRPRFVPTTAVVAIFRNAPAINPDRFRADVDGWLDQEPLVPQTRSTAG